VKFPPAAQVGTIRLRTTILEYAINAINAINATVEASDREKGATVPRPALIQSTGSNPPAAIPTDRSPTHIHTITARALTTHGAREVKRGKKVGKEMQIGAPKRCPGETPWAVAVARAWFHA
jgi:hypothetical protein